MGADLNLRSRSGGSQPCAQCGNRLLFVADSVTGAQRCGQCGATVGLRPRQMSFWSDEAAPTAIPGVSEHDRKCRSPLCGSTDVTILPGKGPHFLGVRCNRCKSVTWIPRPKTSEATP
jgi:hypothetical protein